MLTASRRYTRRSFACCRPWPRQQVTASADGFYSGPYDGDQPVPRRRAIQANEEISKEVFNDGAMAPTYPVSRAEKLRINGLVGLKDALLPESWRLQLVGLANAKSFPQYVSDVTTWNYEYMDPPPAPSGRPFHQHSDRAAHDRRSCPDKTCGANCHEVWKKQGQVTLLFLGEQQDCC